MFTTFHAFHDCLIKYLDSPLQQSYYCMWGFLFAVLAFDHQVYESDLTYMLAQSPVNSTV